MQFQTPLEEARLIRRYKRFLADIELSDGTCVTAHCANPGAMTGLADPNAKIWVVRNDNPKRKLRYSWELVEFPGHDFACVNTAMPNKLVASWLADGLIPELSGYAHVKNEVKYGQNSRVDFLLTDPHKPDTYVEVKAVSLMRQTGLAEFPDSVTKRGTKHLGELADMVAAGHRAVMLYVVQRTDCDRFQIARDIDPAYFHAFRSAQAKGVEALCIATRISPREMKISDKIVRTQP